VLGLGDDAGAGRQTDGGLDADDGVALGRVDDLSRCQQTARLILIALAFQSLLLQLTTSISLGSQGKGNDVGRNTNSAAGAAAAGVDGQVVGAAALATAAGVALGVVVASHVRPLAESGLAEQNGAGIAQLFDNKSITGDDAAEQSPAAGAGVEVVLGGDVVLDDKGDAVQRAPDLASLALSISLGGNGEDVGVDLNDGTGEGD
jgi:hypothetical protein